MCLIKLAGQGFQKNSRSFQKKLFQEEIKIPLFQFSFLYMTSTSIYLIRKITMQKPNTKHTRSVESWLTLVNSFLRTIKNCTLICLPIPF